VATVDVIESERGKYVIALATGQGSESELIAAGRRLANRRDVGHPHVHVVDLEPNSMDQGDRLVVVTESYLR
jgi:hypothetical protein